MLEARYVWLVDIGRTSLSRGFAVAMHLAATCLQQRLTPYSLACRNLIKRFIVQWMVNGAVLTPPRTSPMDSLNSMMREEFHEFILEECQ